MQILPALYYSKTHEWLMLEGNKAFIGISDYAQHQMGDIVFVDMPVLDDELSAGDVLGVVESVKSASDIYAPVNGRVDEINEALIDNPALINESPYESWIVQLIINDLSQLDNLLDADAYEALINEK